jgi:hypothetical protein
MAPSGRQRIDVSCRQREISGEVSPATDRIEGGRAMMRNSAISR